MEDREKSQEEILELFRSPCAEYRDVPFWAWNTKMTREDVDFCLSVFQEMGMGGAFAHSRTGLDIPYLGEEYMELIAYAQKKAEEMGLHLWLYDEDRWPSGFGGGLVTEKQEYRSRFLVWSPRPYEDGEVPEISKKGSTAEAVRSGKRKLLGVYRVWSHDGFLTGYERIREEPLPGAAVSEDPVAPVEPPDPGEPAGPGKREQEEPARDPGGTLWWAYLEVCGDNPWFNGQSYVDTLNPEAIHEFIQITYERYRQVLGERFGREVPGIFTDEPQFTPKHRAKSIDSREAVILPFTDLLPLKFKETYGFDLLDCLPELFYDREQGYSRARYGYHELVSRLFAESYCMQIGKWCEKAGISLTGHLMKEPLLSSQTMYVGEAVRAYAGFQIPGIDMLCDRREFTTAKQAQSIVHQYGKKAMISELYGVTNWDYDFRGHKMQGDWQAALGVTMRAPHLAWTSMEGEAKRDYPASIFYQSPWYREYRQMEDYFARISAVLSRGEAMAEIGVLHPIETCWLKWGAEETMGEEIKELDSRFLQMTDWLLGNGLDFDFISEALFAELYGGTDGETIAVGKMRYRVLVVPFMETMRSTTVEILKQWKAAGGRLVFLAGVPGYVDGMPSDAVEKLSSGCRKVEFSKTALCRCLREYRQVELFYGDGGRAEDLLCQMRREGTRRTLFIAHKYNPARKDCVEKRNLNIRLRGAWSVIRLDPMDGTARWEKCRRGGQAETTELTVDFYDHDSVLLLLEPENGEKSESVQDRRPEGAYEKPAGFLEIAFPYRCPVTLSEPNVLVLDMAQYAFEGRKEQQPEEILRLDNRIRKQLGFPLRTESWPQPWTRGQAQAGGKAHKLELFYTVKSEIEGCEVMAAMEQAENRQIFWNGVPVGPKAANQQAVKKQAVKKWDEGWYVDRRIRTVSLGDLKKGDNELRIVLDFQEKTNLEPICLLGDFGVRVFGRSAVVTEPVKELEFGDWTVQGLPFYGGNVTYHVDGVSRGTVGELEISRFASPLIRVEVNGNAQGTLAFSPYRLNNIPLKKGKNRIDITAYGNRINTFGALHNCDVTDNKAAPDYWRTKGTSWSYEYCLRPSGILKAPVIRERETQEE